MHGSKRTAKTKQDTPLYSWSAVDTPKISNQHDRIELKGKHHGTGLARTTA